MACFVKGKRFTDMKLFFPKSDWKILILVKLVKDCELQVKMKKLQVKMKK
jgi:hypothetical protein